MSIFERSKTWDMLGKHFHLHAQNLNEDRKGRPRPGLPTEGRLWLRMSKDENSHEDASIGLEWAAFTHFCFIGLEMEPYEDPITLKIAIPKVLAVWFHINPRKLGAIIKQHLEWEVSYNSESDCFHWRFGQNPHEWHRSTPKWKDGSFNPWDFLLGKKEEIYDNELVTKHVEIPLPEGKLPAVVKLRERAFKRKRWPFTEYITYADTEPEKPAPVPGKGTESYNCGPDAIYSQHGPARSVEEAMAHFIESVLRTRMKYGGSHKYDGR